MKTGGSEHEVILRRRAQIQNGGGPYAHDNYPGIYLGPDYRDSVSVWRRMSIRHPAEILARREISGGHCFGNGWHQQDLSYRTRDEKSKSAEDSG
jgi:hypothetical protein